MTNSEPLGSWVDGGAKSRIQAFLATITNEDGDGFIPVDERIAVFDNDGTLWPEQPLLAQIAFTIDRFAELTAERPELVKVQPYKAAAEGDLDWYGRAVTRYYQGDPSDMLILMKALPAAFYDFTVEQYQQRAVEFFRTAQHPTLDQPYASLGYTPMVELLRYLEAHDFKVFISSGGDRDFMRGVAEQMYGIPPERVIGSSLKLNFQESVDSVKVLYQEQLEVFNDGKEKPMRIWSRIGRRPVIAVGNSNGDIPMMRFANVADRPNLRILVHHDDADREFAYDAGAEDALARAEERDWLVVSMKNDWQRVFDHDEQPR